VMDYSDPQIIRVDVRILTDEQTAQVAARLRQVLRDNTTVA
jgi:hypothetical protein